MSSTPKPTSAPPGREPTLYDALSSGAPNPRLGGETLMTLTKETVDNDREDLTEDILLLID